MVTIVAACASSDSALAARRAKAQWARARPEQGFASLAGPHSFTRLMMKTVNSSEPLAFRRGQESTVGVLSSRIARHTRWIVARIAAAEAAMTVAPDYFDTEPRNSARLAAEPPVMN